MKGNLRVLEIENDQKNKDIIKILRKTHSNNGFLGFWVKIYQPRAELLAQRKVNRTANKIFRCSLVQILYDPCSTMNPFLL